MLNQKTFKCKRCGECCNVYTIRLDKKDIKRIEERYPRKHFLSYDPFENYFILTKINNKCVFLKKKDRYFCEIHDIRPDICKKYPFFKKNVESCKPITIQTFLNKP